MSLTLEWMIGADDNWCLFDKLDLNDSYFNNDNLRGVFIIWFGPNEKGDEGRVVCVGKGIIRNQLLAARLDPILCRYTSRHMMVTWAEVDALHKAGVEAYLMGVLNPILGEKHPNVVQTLVNLPAW